MDHQALLVLDDGDSEAGVVSLAESKQEAADAATACYRRAVGQAGLAAPTLGD